MADKRKPRTRFEMIMEYLRSLRDSEEEIPKKKKKGEKSIAELINFGGDYEERSEGGVLVGEDTGKTVEKTGRTVYKTEEGDNVSELSTTFKYKGKWINIPSIIMGEELTDDELRELLDEGLIEPTSTHDNLEDAEKAAEERSKSLEFNKGGTSMDEQMKMFGEGGLLDEGGEVDEESGNEVPIGGTKEGVRDDIPAMLSEGEFVFPEDVTRYHGLEKLMTLRQEAKMGLKKMEAMGQMGNSEEATIPDDLPFTMDDLLVVVTGEEEEPKKKDDEPIKAQAGTFVPANQQLSNMGVMGFQESMYGQQGLQNPTATVMPQVPASSVVPTVQAPPQGGYTAPTVPATPVNQPDFVPDVSSQYKPVKYINPTSGETMMINEYQGNPVSAVPAGFIRYDDYIASGGKDPNEEQEVTTGVESTSVQTAQVAGAQDDESKAKASNLEKMREDRERKRVQEYNRVFDTESKSFTDKNDPNYITNEQLIDAYKDQIEAETIAPLIPGVGILAAGMTRLGRGKVNNALDARFGKNAGYDDFRENPEFKKLTEGVTRGSVLKETGSEILGDLKQGLTKEGLGFGDKTDPKNFYNNYDAKYEVGDYDSTRGGTGFKKDPVTGALSGNLNVKEQQAFDNAVDRGDDAIANHFSLVAASRDEKDRTAAKSQDLIKQAQVAKQNGDTKKLKELKADIKANNTGKVQLGDASIDEIIEHGSSSLTAVNEGRSEPSTGIFKAPKPKKDDDKSSIFNKDRTLKTAKKDPKPPKSSGFAGMGDDPAAQFGGSPMASSSSRSSSSSSSSSSPSAASAAGGCVIATHAVASGAFQANDKANAVEWCKKTLHDKWWGETMRRGYRYLGRKHIANGTAETVYKEFKECIEWANGKRPFTIKVAGRYYYRAIQTFFVGLFVKEDV